MKLAIQGGTPVRTKPFPPHNTIGEEEKRAVMEVLDTGVLSKFLGTWHPDFNGGPQIQALEREWARYFGAKHAIAVNSCTSGLYCAVGAIGVEPGEEIIVSPYTMSASATAPLVYNAVPVFADIERDMYCLDPESVAERITARTRAIIVVDIFGQPYDAVAINAIARKHGLVVIEDTAQAPGARLSGKYAGTLGDIGIYSLNYHKHIHCGEGGVVVTDDDGLADRVRLIRNHAEAVVEKKGTTNLANLIGFNYRMTEIEAAITRCQLPKLEGLVEARRRNCAYLNEQLSLIPAISPTRVREGAEHAYYVQPLQFDDALAGVSRDVFMQAVRAELAPVQGREDEGVKIGCGYVKPLYLQPLFQKQMAYGSKGCPFVEPWYEGKANYSRGACPNAELMHERMLFTHEMVYATLADQDLKDVVDAFAKVWENRARLSSGSGAE